MGSVSNLLVDMMIDNERDRDEEDEYVYSEAEEREVEEYLDSLTRFFPEREEEEFDPNCFTHIEEICPQDDELDSVGGDTDNSEGNE